MSIFTLILIICIVSFSLNSRTQKAVEWHRYKINNFILYGMLKSWCQRKFIIFNKSLTHFLFLPYFPFSHSLSPSFSFSRRHIPFLFLLLEKAFHVTVYFLILLYVPHLRERVSKWEWSIQEIMDYNSQCIHKYTHTLSYDSLRGISMQK